MTNHIEIDKIHAERPEERLATLCAQLMREGIAYRVTDEPTHYDIQITGY